MHLLTVTSSSGSNAEKPPQKKKKVHGPRPLSLLLLPDELSLNCLARVPRCYHPSVSMVSTALRRLIASPAIYVERSLLRRTEHVLYVALRSCVTETPRWYTLNLKPFGQAYGVNHSLVPVPSFPPVPSWGMSIFTVGSEIYVIGGCVNEKMVSTVFVIDCPSYTCRFLPNMKQARACAAAGIVGGKLYVIGGCKPRSSNWVEAFDLKTQTWETVTGLNKVEMYEKMIRSFLIDDKIYLMDRKSSFVYDPKEGRLERDPLLNGQWSVGSCVIEDKLYSFGRRNTIWEFDTLGRVWRQVRGLEDLPDKAEGSKMVNYGGKLVILVNLQEHSTEIWYTEIELERREGGEVWGTILLSTRVLASEAFSPIVASLLRRRDLTTRAGWVMHLSSVTSSSGANADRKLHDDNDAPSSLLLLPDEISLNCLARVPRCYYPWVSLVSTTLRRLIASPEIYTERSALRRTEHVLYVALRPYCTRTLEWYTLNLIKPSFGQEEIKHRLVPVPSFPLVPYWGMSIVVVGSEMYFLGGSVDESFVSTAFVIDCPSYTCRSLPNMKQERGCAAAGIVDGKLYVIGGCDPLSPNWVEAFDLKTQTWETVRGLSDVEVYEKTIRSFVMDDKICIMDRDSSFVYDPKDGVLERDLLLNKQWRVGSCVIDDKLYSFDQENILWEFDPVSRVWTRVKGLEDLPGVRDVTKMANCGGKIAILCNVEKCSTEIWYTEIGLERREGGEAWGTILWSGLVLASEGFSTIVRSLSVSF
ncbi:hypothetical protein HID58_078862 [Brassica napus]|nr:hypothetical protein HID58_078862 [Brassica napus]CAF2032907.1 unnamed protein product [Brassica napus]